MRKEFNKVPKLKTENGTLIGGFVSLNESQLGKIKGGKKTILDTNDKCHNLTGCQGDNVGCTNDKWCE